MSELVMPNITRVEARTKPSPELVRRIKDSYQLALQKASLPTNSLLWSSLITGKQSDIHEALMSSDDQAIIDKLSDPQSNNLYYGVDNLAKDVIANFTADSLLKDHVELRSVIDKLVVALGDAPLFNPEGGSRYPYKTRPRPLPVDDVVPIIDTYFGGALNFPNPFPGELGIATSKGVVSYRAVHAIYQAVLARRYSDTNCLEIGGGMGRTAYYGRLLGLHYTIIDLPMTIVGQALFLASALGEDAIWLLGDTMPRGDRIALLPPSELQTIKHVDVVLNVDSLTEMGSETAIDYVTWVRQACWTFLSINHEANDFTVHSLCRSLAPNSLRSRNPYLLREGYVEEIFSFGPSLPSVHASLVSIQESTSWRITYPLRRLKLSLKQTLD
ncbi:putative sugar O-methyltransferase [Rhizobium leguminosarum]|uniref:putative sugar O-methyltransferase n=1 Tax=Rhizobium leguminosarum TaxID=384 RepID=UPI00103AE009|nr:putative sugar O-methyltransferase [Rhizobium leguminosarum]TCA20959.1 putative sugar O-methyltransferase [Rhizobium leguminosarum bv. viciae]